MADFSKRSEDIEIMDDLESSGEFINQALRELEVINTLLGGNHVTLNGLKQLTKNVDHKVVIADLGCGGGDILRLIRKWCSRNSIQADLIGIDANPSVVAFAQQHTPQDFSITFESIDIFSDDFKKRKFDIVIGTLFFHHFPDEALSSFFKQLKSQASIGFVINDIHRHWFAYHSIRILTKWFSRSTMVKNDAPLSVLRAFRKSDLTNILREAGIEKYTIRWMWAFRWQVVVWSK